jgi:glycosyltransferase involved in cell wall biosynthesis
MEGFGMSAQEAAATEIPVVSSDLVPFVVGFLVGDEYEEIPLLDKKGALKKGAGGIVAPADNVDAFAEALLYLLEHREERLAMGERAYEITIPKFTWHRMIRDFLKAIGFSLPGIMSEEEEKRESYNN